LNPGKNSATGKTSLKGGGRPQHLRWCVRRNPSAHQGKHTKERGIVLLQAPGKKEKTKLTERLPSKGGKILESAKAILNWNGGEGLNKGEIQIAAGWVTSKKGRGNGVMGAV